jgi:hypothetical protein
VSLRQAITPERMLDRPTATAGAVAAQQSD